MTVVYGTHDRVHADSFQSTSSSANERGRKLGERHRRLLTRDTSRLWRGHALPLPAGRLWRPRTSRRNGARCPRNDCPQWTRQRPVRDQGQAVAQPRPRTIRVRELAVSAHRPESCPGPRAVRVRIAERPRLVRGQATVADASSPWTVRTFAQSTTRPWPRIVRVHERALAPVSPCPRTRTVREQPAGGPVQSESNPAYVLV